MIIKQFTAGPLANNIYILLDENSKCAVIIDATELLPEIIETLNGYKVEYILLTHGHFDHIMGLNELKKNFNTKAVISKNDLVISDNVNEFTRLFGFPDMEVPSYEIYINDNDEIKVGNINIKVISTPGHTEGGVCYLVDDKLFSGDTLFRESFGRTDLLGGDFKKLSDSIKNRLFKLDDNITVYPGHGPSTTIGYEKLHNEIGII